MAYEPADYIYNVPHYRSNTCLNDLCKNMAMVMLIMVVLGRKMREKKRKLTCGCCAFKVVVLLNTQSQSTSFTRHAARNVRSTAQRPATTPHTQHTKGLVFMQVNNKIVMNLIDLKRCISPRRI